MTQLVIFSLFFANQPGAGPTAYDYSAVDRSQKTVPAKSYCYSVVISGQSLLRVHVKRRRSTRYCVSVGTAGGCYEETSQGKNARRIGWTNLLPYFALS